MKVGILEAGAPPAELSAAGGYASMFRRLLGPAFKTQIFNVVAGELPKSDSDCQAWLVTGSASSPYDEDPWIGDLEDFLRAASGRAPMVGICFGHQLMAQAFGGRVEKSQKGRALGLHRYEILEQPPWMDAPLPISLPVAHRDQVTAVGPDCRVLGGNDFTPLGMLAYPARRAFSLQSHPEFDLGFARALVEFRRPEVGNEKADAAAESLSDPNDSQRVSVWLRRFLTSGARS